MVVAHWCCVSLVLAAFVVPVTHGRLVDQVINRLYLSSMETDNRWTAAEEAGRCYMTSDKAENRSESPMQLLLTHIAGTELRACVPSIVFDPFLPMTALRDDIYDILSTFPFPRLIGRLQEPTTPSWMPKPALHSSSRKHPGRWQEVVGNHDLKCRSYVVIIDDVIRASEFIGNATKDRTIIVTRSPLWRIRDFLSGPLARRTLNLLVIQDRNWKRSDPKQGFLDINLMTHRLFGDSLGGSFPQILTSWRCDHFTRPWVQLFPFKMLQGFSGHQFKVATVDSPPFVYKTTTADMESSWDGYEIRIMSLLAGVLNFTLDYREPILDAEDRSGILASTRVMREVLAGAAEVGAAGVYITTESLAILDMPQQHTQDCAAFMTLASVALPRYRAILGPFQWTVWLAVSLAYILAIIPLVFSHHLSLGLLIRHPTEIENMFWYVFGTFTNLFEFKGEDTWVGSKRDSTRMIVGWYWAFSIIITACYTGSVISFIAFPVFPALIESMKDVLDGGYRIGTLNSGGWTTWFTNSSDPETEKLLKNVDLVPTVWEGIQNMTHASFFHPYSFLGSRLYLEHVVRTNYSAQNKRSMVHIGEQCFVPFWVSLIFPRDAVYSERFSHMVLRADQSGLIEREKRNVRWDIQRSSSGALLQMTSGSSLRFAPTEERMLTLDDTQGMFLLLGAGVLIAVFALTVENVFGRVSSLRDRCPPGPRRRSSAGVDPLWMAGSRSSSANYNTREDRPKRPSHGRYRRSVNSLPGNILDPTEGIVKGRSPSIATAPPIVLIESVHSMEDLDEAACLQTLDQSEEPPIPEDGYCDTRKLSIFSWVSALASKLGISRVSQPSDPFVDSDSSTLTRDQSQESDSSECDLQSSPTETCTVEPKVEPHCRNLESGLERCEPSFRHVESVFGSRQDVAFEDLSQPEIRVEPTRLSFLELLKPLEKMEAEEIQSAREDQTTGDDEFEQPTPKLEAAESTSKVDIEQSTPKLETEESTSPIVIVAEEISKSEPLKEKQLREKNSTGPSLELHRRTPSTSTPTQSTGEPKRKLFRVPRTSIRPKRQV